MLVCAAFIANARSVSCLRKRQNGVKAALHTALEALRSMPPSGAVALGAFLAAYAVVENNFACCRWLAGRCFGLDLWRRKTTVECAETDYNRCALLKSAREMLSQGSASAAHMCTGTMPGHPSYHRAQERTRHEVAACLSLDAVSLPFCADMRCPLRTHVQHIMHALCSGRDDPDHAAACAQHSGGAS